MKFWPLHPYYKRSNWKTWPSERFSEVLTSKLWNKKNTYKAYRNGAKLNYIHSPMVLSKFFDRSIQGIATWNSREKIKLAIPHDQNYGPWLVKDGKAVFRNSHGKFRCQYQASRQARARLAVFPSQNFRYFSAF